MYDRLYQVLFDLAGVQVFALESHYTVDEVNQSDSLYDKIGKIGVLRQQS